MNDYGVKETACTHCLHRDVCAKKDIFLKAQKAADELDILWEDGTGGIASQKVRNIDWIGPVELTCKYHIMEQPLLKRNMGVLDQ